MEEILEENLQELSEEILDSENISAEGFEGAPAENESVLQQGEESSQDFVVEAEEKNETENVEEPVVPADTMEEQLSQPRHVQQKQQSNNVSLLKEINQNVGVKSDSVEEMESMSEEERLSKLHGEFISLKRSKGIAWGEIVGVEPSNLLHTFFVIVDYDGVRVAIRDEDFYEDTFDFGSNYEALTDETDKLIRRTLTAKYYLGAVIPFTVTEISVENYKNEQTGETVKLLTVLGNRKEAMAILRDIWFLHENTKNPNAMPRKVEKDMIAKAHVLTVRSDMVLVECLGVETRISARDLSDDVIENCQDFVKAGDNIKVRIRGLHINDADSEFSRVYLAVSGRIRQVPRAIYGMKEGATYLGTVDKFNRQKKIYNVVLRNHVNAIVQAQDVQGEIPLKHGDTISVKVIKIFDDYVRGLAIKM